MSYRFLTLKCAILVAYLLHQVGYVGQKGQVTGTLYSLSYATLEFQRSTGDAAGKQFTLLVEELLEEFGVFVIDVFDTAAFETAVFFLLDIH